MEFFVVPSVKIKDVEQTSFSLMSNFYLRFVGSLRLLPPKASKETNKNKKKTKNENRMNALKMQVLTVLPHLS